MWKNIVIGILVSALVGVLAYTYHFQGGGVATAAVATVAEKAPSNEDLGWWASAKWTLSTFGIPVMGLSVFGLIIFFLRSNKPKEEREKSDGDKAPKKPEKTPFWNRFENLPRDHKKTIAYGVVMIVMMTAPYLIAPGPVGGFYTDYGRVLALVIVGSIAMTFILDSKESEARRKNFVVLVTIFQVIVLLICIGLYATETKGDDLPSKLSNIPGHVSSLSNPFAGDPRNGYEKFSGEIVRAETITVPKKKDGYSAAIEPGLSDSGEDLTDDNKFEFRFQDQGSPVPGRKELLEPGNLTIKKKGQPPYTSGSPSEHITILASEAEGLQFSSPEGRPTKVDVFWVRK